MSICDQFHALHFAPILLSSKSAIMHSYIHAKFSVDKGERILLLGGISSSVLSVFFTDKFALSQSECKDFSSL